MVYFHTMRRQAIYSVVEMLQQEQLLRSEIELQQVRLSATTQSPSYIRDSVSRLELDICPPDECDDEYPAGQTADHNGQKWAMAIVPGEPEPTR